MNNETRPSQSSDQLDPFWILMLLVCLAFLIWWLFFRKDRGAALIPAASLAAQAIAPPAPASLVSQWSPLQ